jgi:hypothetical protein
LHKPGVSRDSASAFMQKLKPEQPLGCDRHSQECAKKDLWHGALVKIAKQKGYARGWVSHKYREKFGHWPTLNYPPEREPTVEILNWVRSRQIAYAKARQQYG